MNVKIEIIPHEKQRYPTVGDWVFDDAGNLTIYVSKMSDWRREILVAVHELCETAMCKQDGVTQEEVDAFDKAYEANRPEGDDSEPGDDPKAPYRRQHFVATNIERTLARELGVDWEDYADEVEAFP